MNSVMVEANIVCQSHKCVVDRLRRSLLIDSGLSSQRSVGGYPQPRLLIDARQLVYQRASWWFRTRWSGRARLLKRIRVQLGDMEPQSETGYVAFRSVGSVDDCGEGRIRRERLYR